MVAHRRHRSGGHPAPGSGENGGRPGPERLRELFHPRICPLPGRRSLRSVRPGRFRPGPGPGRPSRSWLVHSPSTGQRSLAPASGLLAAGTREDDVDHVSGSVHRRVDCGVDPPGPPPEAVGGPCPGLGSHPGRPERPGLRTALPDPGEPASVRRARAGKRLEVPRRVPARSGGVLQALRARDRPAAPASRSSGVASPASRSARFRPRWLCWLSPAPRRSSISRRKFCPGCCGARSRTRSLRDGEVPWLCPTDCCDSSQT